MALLDWSKTGTVGDPAACVVCRRPALCRSPKGMPCHKTCAEGWVDAHPNATRQTRGRRSR